MLSILCPRLPTAEAFSEAASALGLENQDHIVVYTTQKCFSAARCWWTFRVFGHEKVRALRCLGATIYTTKQSKTYLTS